MSDPFWYLFRSLEDDDPVDEKDVKARLRTVVDSSTGYVSNTASTTTASDERVATPSTTTDTYTWPNDDGRAADAGLQNQPANSLTFDHDSGTPSAEPTVVLAEIQKAAEDVAQLTGRFGPKMSTTLWRSRIKKALLAHPSKLQLPSLRYADSFTCRFTRIFEKPLSPSGEAPLLWWLWDALLEFCTPSGRTKGCTLDFAPTRNTDIALSYTIHIRLCNNASGVPNIELTATYGGVFNERRIFDAPIPRFSFPEPGFSKTTTATLVVDQPPYRGNGCYDDTLDYLMPRPGNIWRGAMKVLKEEEKGLVTALAESCKANDDICYMSENQGLQCRNLTKRFPPLARGFVQEKGLVGKEGGAYSRRANLAPGPKD